MAWQGETVQVQPTSVQLCSCAGTTPTMTTSTATLCGIPPQRFSGSFLVLVLPVLPVLPVQADLRAPCNSASFLLYGDRGLPPCSWSSTTALSPSARAPQASSLFPTTYRSINPGSPLSWTWVLCLPAAIRHYPTGRRARACGKDGRAVRALSSHRFVAPTLTCSMRCAVGRDEATVLGLKYDDAVVVYEYTTH